MTKLPRVTYTEEERKEFYDEFFKNAKAEYEAFKEEVRGIIIGPIASRESNGSHDESVTSFITDIFLPGGSPITCERRGSINLRCAFYEALMSTFEFDEEDYIDDLTDHQIHNLKMIKRPLACMFYLLNARGTDNRMMYQISFNNYRSVRDIIHRLTDEIDHQDVSAFIMATEAYQYKEKKNHHLAFVLDNIDIYDAEDDIIDYSTVVSIFEDTAEKISPICKDLYDYYMSKGIYIIKGYLHI